MPKFIRLFLLLRMKFNNFLSGFYMAEGDYIAYSDQDDYGLLIRLKSG